MAPINKTDLVLKNGKIVTLNPNDDIVEAVAIKDGIIIAAGPARDLETFAAKDSAVIDLDGKTVTPGFVESHCHPSMAGLNLCFEVDVKQAASIDDIIVLLQQKAEQLPRGNWVKDKFLKICYITFYTQTFAISFAVFFSRFFNNKFCAILY